VSAAGAEVADTGRRLVAALSEVISTLGVLAEVDTAGPAMARLDPVTAYLAELEALAVVSWPPVYVAAADQARAAAAHAATAAEALAGLVTR
jgi:hypothetical protein